MKKLRKALAILIASVLSIGSLAACDLSFLGGGKESSAPTENSSIVETSSGAETETSSESEEETSSEEHTCVYEGDWKSNKTGHWRVCSCGKLGDYAKHTGEAADCESLPVCTTCEVEYGTAPGHSYGTLSDGVNGMAYYCDCGAYITNNDLVDFVVEVEADRDPVVLQLSDTQIMNYGSAEELCYRYIRDAVNATNPDLILITGDVVYGKFDPNGSILKDLIRFMETLKTPWAPVFGNHDNESEMGVDWQCQQFEAAEYCLFKQGDLTGNGNYSVGIEQGGELMRVFYMLDSNGCGGASEASLPKIQKDAGFGDDQKMWFINSIEEIKSCSPDTKFSLAYHIQIAQFRKAFEKYDEYNDLYVSGSSLENPVNLDTLESAEEGDFGFIGAMLKGPWDTTYTLAKRVKELGVDSHFVGHEHCNSASIVLEGVRYQYGQKSSQYDRYNIQLDDGSIVVNTKTEEKGTPLMGGTAIVLSKQDGSIIDGYIHLYDFGQ
ncbi:MAG: metallophosphoesterase [Clostridia bacterium]|nr:metallophosphoesterase [Clostridia bacterium]